MRMFLAAGLVLCFVLAGCTTTSNPSDGPRSVSVSYQKSQQNDRVTLFMTMTAANNIDDWSELTVSGCSAPKSGEIVTPHKFADCTGQVVIKYTETGATLYRSP